MFVDSLLYRLWDADPKITGFEDRRKKDGPILTTIQDAKLLNPKGYGIFHTVGVFKDNNRRGDQLLRPISWVVDMDNESKQAQWYRIRFSPLTPDIIIESKNGYHVYWICLYGTRETNREILLLLAEYFHSDKKIAIDTTLIRTPNFYHMKDPNDPFLVTIKYCNVKGYKEKEMLRAFRLTKREKFNKERYIKKADIDSRYALEKLSGHPAVNHETFEFDEKKNGITKIIINGKTHSPWIDKFGYIGSTDRGGPTILQWLKWYVKNGYTNYTDKELEKIVEDIRA